MKKKVCSPRGGGRSNLRSHCRRQMPVSLTEQQVMKVFNRIKKVIIKDIGHTGPTTDLELTKIDKRVLGTKYTGTFTVEHKPKKSKKNQYFIINNHRKDQPGEHWIAVIKQNQKFYIYDSFGRSSKDLIPSFIKNKKYFDSDNDIEQSRDSAICGALCLSWLVCFDRLGKDNAMLI